MSADGKTMLVITHDRAVVESLCDREIPLG